MPQTLFNNFLLLPIFVALCFFVLYLPGTLLLRKIHKKLSTLEFLYLSLLCGISILIIQTIITGLLGVRPISYILLFSLSLYSIFLYHTSLFTSIISLFKSKHLMPILLLGVLLQGFINFPSGLLYENGLNFWSSQGHDGLWHVSLIEEISRNFPPSMPLYAGHTLTNYHYISDIFMGEFFRLFPFFTSLDLYFRFYPILFSFLIGLGVYVFVTRIKNSTAALWSVFFTYFCGSFGYIILILRNQFPIGGETMFWASQGNTILGNPPHALGIIYLTTILLLLSLYEKFRSNRYLVLTVFIGLFMVGIKVSSGILAVLGLVAAGISLLFKEKNPALLIAGLIIGVTNFVTLKIISPVAESFLVFNPLWFPRTMMVVRLDNVDWELRRQHYLSLHNFKANVHLVFHEGYATLLFIIGNTGLRILGLIEIITKSLKHPGYIFMISGMVGALGVVLIFVQNGVTYNLIQFIQIYLHYFGIFAGITVTAILAKLHRQKYLQIITAILVVTFSIPTVIGNLFDFYGPGKNPLATVSNAEIEGLNWLKNNSSPDSVILTKPFDKNAHYRYKSQPIPINAWYPSMYVHSLTGRHTFLSGEEQLQITGYDIKADLESANNFFKQSNTTFLSKYPINYIYVRKDELDIPLNEQLNNIKLVFNNPEVMIYKNEN